MTESRATVTAAGPHRWRSDEPDRRTNPRSKRRIWISAAIASVAGAAACGSLLSHPRPALVWNVSASSIRGLYAVGSPGDPRAGDIVIAWAPARARSLAAARGYLPRMVPLVKPVAAAAGDRVCATRQHVFINGRPAALRRVDDPRGRRMPWWSGCHLLRHGELFLLSATVREAFDGRYFGMTRRSELVGMARLLWAAPAKGRSDG